MILKNVDQLKQEIDRDFSHVNHDILVEEKLVSIILNFDLKHAINDKHVHNVIILRVISKKILIVKLFQVAY